MIAEIQETRWQGFKIFDTSAYMVCYSGSNEHNLFSTSFMIHTRVKDKNNCLLLATLRIGNPFMSKHMILLETDKWKEQLC
jgi:hypothetical protein